MKTSKEREQGQTRGGTGDRTLRTATAAIVVFNALLVVLALLQPAGSRGSQALMSTGGVVGPLLALPLCYWGYREASRMGDRASPGRRWAPI